MINDNIKGFLGLCRRSGKISPGHDAAVASIKKGKAVLAVTCCDCSQRLKDEIADECSFNGRNVRYLNAAFTMQEAALAMGMRAGVFTVDDRNLADRLYGYLTGGNEYDEKI